MTDTTEEGKRRPPGARPRKDKPKAKADVAIIEALVRARTDAKLSQTELAKRIGTTQSAVARLEGGGVSPSLSTLRRYAEATGTRLHLKLLPREHILKECVGSDNPCT